MSLRKMIDEDDDDDDDDNEFSALRQVQLASCYQWGTNSESISHSFHRQMEANNLFKVALQLFQIQNSDLPVVRHEPLLQLRRNPFRNVISLQDRNARLIS